MMAHKFTMPERNVDFLYPKRTYKRLLVFYAWNGMAQ